MSITDKARKTLWARSGNRCAMCRKELVADKNEHDKNLNIGDECHIISSQTRGPRHDPEFKNFDTYENLILLCKNDHKTIDELWETFTVDIVKQIKKKHEDWIKTTIDKANDTKLNKPSFLRRLNTGQQIIDIMKGATASRLNNDEPNSQEEVQLLGAFLENISDWIDMIGMGVFEKGQEIQLAFDFNKEIKELEDKGFLVFGDRTKEKYYFTKEKYDILEVAEISLIRETNPAIINLENLDVKYSDDISKVK